MGYILMFKPDPITETRLKLNGESPPSLNTEDKLRQSIANRNNGVYPPSEEDELFLLNNIEANVIDPNAEFRAKLAADTRARYERGIPICNNTLREYLKALDGKSATLDKTLLPDIVDYRGKIDQARLKAALPDNVKDAWPKRFNKDLCLKESTLLKLDNDYSKHLLIVKELIASRMLSLMVVDIDGRHRFYPNPFGTATGRERPYGASLMYLPKRYFPIIKPTAGMVVVSFDYQQQEPAILASLAKDSKLMEAYQAGDIYQYIAKKGPWSSLERTDIKRMTIAFLYGADAFTLSNLLDVPMCMAKQWLVELRAIFKVQLQWLELYAHNAYQTGQVSCLDWSMKVGLHTKPKSIKNWPVQAAGADILRRTCLALGEADINVIFCQHDSIMVELKAENYKDSCELVQRIMMDSSKAVLDGFQLKTKVEYEAFPVITESSLSTISSMEFIDDYC
jgi:hypothetical protein